MAAVEMKFQRGHNHQFLDRRNQWLRSRIPHLKSWSNMRYRIERLATQVLRGVAAVPDVLMGINGTWQLTDAGQKSRLRKLSTTRNGVSSMKLSGFSIIALMGRHTAAVFARSKGNIRLGWLPSN